MIDSGYSILQSGGAIKILYAVDISNPNQDYAIVHPKISITAKDADGKILNTEEQSLMGIAAGDRYTYGNDLYYEGDAPTRVEIRVGNDEDNYVAQATSEIIPSASLAVSNTSDSGSYTKTFTGEVTNNSSKDQKYVAITIIYKSADHIVGGQTTYFDDLKSGETKPFEIASYPVFNDYDAYEIYAYQW